MIPSKIYLSFFLKVRSVASQFQDLLTDIVTRRPKLICRFNSVLERALFWEKLATILAFFTILLTDILSAEFLGFNTYFCT